jgi:membrane protein YqaA with SNARE-associated domain
MGRIVGRIQAFALALGAPGLFLVALLDSSLVPLPEVNDLLLVFMVTAHKPRMLLYASVAVLGSLAGSLLLFVLGQRGGEALLRKRFGSVRLDRARRTLQRYGVVSVLITCLLPPPAPFKLFMLLAGAAGISVGRFAIAIAIGRSVRFFGLAFLAVRYGDRALQLIHDEGVTVSLVLIGLLLAAVAGYVLWVKAQARKDR